MKCDVCGHGNEDEVDFKYCCKWFRGWTENDLYHTDCKLGLIDDFTQICPDKCDKFECLTAGDKG